MAKKEEILVSLELALGEILNVENMNAWISVKERAISKILIEAGVHKNYSSIVVEELKRIGLIEREGERSAMRYKIKSNVIPDSSAIALKIYNEFRNKTKKCNEERGSDGYPSSRSSDLKPLKYKDEGDSFNKKFYNGKPNVVKRHVNIPTLGDMRFMIHLSSIIECKVISVHYDLETVSKILYDVEFVNPEFISSFEENELDEASYHKYIIMPNQTIKDLFETPEDAADYLVRKFVKYQKR